MRRASIIASAAVVLTSFTVGCASKAVSPADRSAAANSATGSAMSPVAKAGSAVGGFFTASAATVSKGTKAMTAAFTPKPKDEPAHDPTSLNTKPRPPGPDLFLATARMRESQGDLDGASAEYEKGLKAFPGDLQLLLAYGHLQDRQGKLVEATRIYQEAATRHPKDAAAHNDLGLCYARRSMLDQAAGSLSKAVELQPDKKLYRNNLATVKVEQGRIDDAFAQLSAVHPVATAHYNLGFLLVQKGNQQAAAAQFQQALAADPSLVDAQKWLAKLGGTPEAQLASSRRTPPTSTQVLQTPTIPTQQIRSSEARMVEAPIPSSRPDYLQPQASSAFQVRYPQPSAESRSADDGAVPPTPDRFDGAKPAEASGDALRMLPPVNSAYFAPSRY